MNPLLLLPPGIARNRLWLRAGAVPSFHIAPASRQTAADLITGSVLGTYNSATPAMAVGPDGLLFTPTANAPVIEYDPTTLSCLGARVWGVVLNNLLRSEAFDLASWTKAGATVSADSIAAPNGTTTADRLQEDSTTGSHIATQSSAGGSTSSAVTFSVFAKAGERTKIRLAFSSVTSWAGAGGAAVIFDLSAGTATPNSSTPTDYGIKAYPGGWYRCWITGTPTTSLTPQSNVFLYTTASSYTGDGTSGAFVWGGQLNPGLIAPYVPTTTTTASSTAEVWDLTNLAAGANNIRSLYARVRTPASGTSGIISLNDNSSSNRIALQTTGTSAKLVAVTSGSTVADITGGTISANTAFNIAARIVGDDYAVSVNGSPVVTDTAGARAVVDRIFFGRTQAGEYLNGYIEECAGWTQYLSDSQLQAVARS